MAKRRSTPWFAVKRYGYGTGLPIAWQGWLATALFIAAMVANAVFLTGLPHLLCAAVLIGGFVWLCFAKTDGRYRWRWGERR